MSFTTSSPQPKSLMIDIMKGMAIYLVVCGHVIQRNMVLHQADFFLNPLFYFIYTFHMPVFFFLSGYLLYHSLLSKSIDMVARSRIKSLFLPYLSWSLLAVAVTIVLKQMDEHAIISARDLLQELAQQIIFSPGIWFLWVLLVLHILFLCCEKFRSPWNWYLHGICVCVIFVVPLGELMAFFYIKWFYLFFFAGYIFARFKDGWGVKTISCWVWVVIAAGFFTGLFFWKKTDFIYIHHMTATSKLWGGEVLRWLYRYAMGFAGIALLAGLAKMLSQNTCSRLFAALGRYALDIYLLQRFLVEGLYPRMISYLQIDIDFNSWIFMGIYVPLTAALLIAICYFISKWLLRPYVLLRLLFLGGRS